MVKILSYWLQSRAGAGHNGLNTQTSTRPGQSARPNGRVVNSPQEDRFCSRAHPPRSRPAVPGKKESGPGE
jgi:hypothetical protein